MRAIRLVARYEISTILTKRSFWLTTLLFPAVVLVLNLGSMRLATLSEARQRDRLENVSSQVVGYVDLSGRITTLPSDIAPETILPFASEDEARGALAAGRISRYYVVPADWVETGNLRLVDRQLTFSLGEARGPFAYVLYTNLLGDEVRARRLLMPDEITRYPLDSNATESDNGPLGMAYVAMFIFFFLLTMSSSLLLQSVSREKENRTAEVLLLSLRPHELMAGKILGLGLVALLQGAVWVSAAALLGSRPLFLGLSSSLRLSASTLPWLIAYLALGYLQYAALMAALGAMAPSARESGQFTFVVLLPLMVPLWLNQSVTQQPNGPLALALSLFPLSSPVTMATRLVITQVPLWQLAAGLAALALTSWLLVRLAGRLFGSEALLSRTALTWQWLIGKLRTPRGSQPA